MKKVIIAAAIVCAAVCSQAAASSWKVMGGNMYLGNGTDKYTGTAYVFSVAIIAQSDLFDAFASGPYDFAGNAAGTIGFSNAAVSTTANAFEYGTVGTDYGMYFVVVNGDDIYFSTILSNKSALNPPNQQSLSFGSQAGSKIAAQDGFQGAGAWSAVPEPTSGLLLLLGMAGLALKRKRA